MRVLEDAARFVLDDTALCTQFKDIRHGLQGALAVLPSGWLEANRDAAHDVGTVIDGEHESARSSHHHVTAAAGKRLGEALRSLEECMKTIDPVAAHALEGLRYRAYDAERDLLMRMGSAARRQWRVCVLLTESLCVRPWQEVLAAAIAGGADCIQVREKDMPAHELAERVRSVISIARPAGVSVVVNDRADIALACGADGVHVGQGDMSIADVRRMAGTSLLVGVSTHSVIEARAARDAGADVCGVGAMFATTLKPAITPGGSNYLRAYLAECARIPHLAIGGITPENIGELLVAGCQGVAVSSVVCGAQDPARVVRSLREAITGAAT
ncbi:MAG: thiamine phosphate synthase [Planctomycetota bacterium]